MRPWRVAAVVAVALAVLGGAWWLLVASPWLRVATVEVVGAAPDREQIVRRVANPTINQPLVEVDTNAIADGVSASGYFADVQVIRSWPHELLIRVESRSPVVASLLPGSVVELIDREGVAYERVSATPEGVLEAVLAKPADARSRATAASVALALPVQLRSQATKFTIDASARATFVIDGVQVLWGDASESAIKAAVLRPLLDKGHVARIDLTVPMNPVTSQETSTSGST